MAISRIEGKNFSYENGAIQFFGAEASRTDRGWCINWTPFGDVPVEVEPRSPLLEDIQACIEDDIAGGNRDKIKMLLVKPENAAVLFLLKKISAKDLKKAQEHDGVIDIPDINVFEDYFLTVRIMQDPEYGCATADADGNIL